MRQLKLFRWAAALTLAILLCTSAAARAFAAASLTPLGWGSNRASLNHQVPAAFLVV